MSSDTEHERGTYYRFNLALTRIASLGLCACLLVGCAASQKTPKQYPEEEGHPDVANKAFIRRMHLPYVASKTRRRQIERACRELNVKMSDTQALAILGPPDLKYYFDGFPPEVPPSQTWTYVYYWRHLKIGYEPNWLILHFDATSPHTISAIDFPSLSEHGR